MATKTLIHKIQEKIKGKSPAFLLKRLFFFHLRLFCNKRLNLYCKKLVPAQENSNSNIRVKVAEESNLDERSFGWNGKGCALGKMREGHLLFLSEKDNKYVFYAFVEKKRVQILALGGICLAIPEDWGYLSSVYVPVENRKQGIAGEALENIENYLVKNTGIKNLFFVTDRENLAANRLYHAKGFKHIQSIRFLELFRIRLYQVAPAGNKKTSKLYWNRIDFLKEIFNAA
jgi:RimJ/RimL family protein N-acetyltransferase